MKNSHFPTGQNDISSFIQQVRHPKMLHLLWWMSKQIFTINKLEPANVWHFCLKNDRNQAVFFRLTNHYSSNLNLWKRLSLICCPPHFCFPPTAACSCFMRKHINQFVSQKKCGLITANVISQCETLTKDMTHGDDVSSTQWHSWLKVSYWPLERVHGAAVCVVVSMHSHIWSQADRGCKSLAKGQTDLCSWADYRKCTLCNTPSSI